MYHIIVRGSPGGNLKDVCFPVDGWGGDTHPDRTARRQAVRSSARRAGVKASCSVAAGEVVGDGVGGVAIQRMSGAVVA
ncbi:MAG: hypothetical protein LC687_05815, partial [Actinobacteria bacterium]|nr:hypothetical protein [Actinomycetota bacterium]